MNIKYIKDESGLTETANILKGKTQFSFDTEFDRFQFGYGFTLSLLQIYDGENCYIIDPKAFNGLQLLWPVFNNEAITKIVYSCSEDIQILKLNGFVPKNIYDLQIAAKLCNSAANSFADVLKEELGKELNKSSQRSDWRQRPLTETQIEYACNDVISLISLKKIFEERATQKGVSDFIKEDNEDCEKIEISPFRLKLSGAQRKRYSRDEQKRLFALMDLRNNIAEKSDLPPFKICSDSVLEYFIDQPGTTFTTSAKGVHRIVNNDGNFEKQFNKILQTKSGDLPDLPLYGDKKFFSNTYNPELLLCEEDYEKIKAFISKKYGTIAGDYIIRGFKKSLNSNMGFEHLKNYQKKEINAAAICVGIKFSLT